MNVIADIAPHIKDPWVLLVHWSKYSGYSRDAFNGKVRAGVWLEGKHWIKGPDGKIQINWQAIQQWKESSYDQTFLKQAASF
jgi:hypothetical protein